VGLLKKLTSISTRSVSSRGFVCHIKEGLNDARRNDLGEVCEGLPLYAKHASKRYCVLHYPGDDKEGEKFGQVVERRLTAEDFRFSYAFFPEGESEFHNVRFEASADFSIVSGSLWVSSEKGGT